MKIVLSQCNFTVGDFVGNCEKIRAIYALHAATADAVVFSELALSSYCPSDLLTQPEFLAVQEQALNQLMLHKTSGHAEFESHPIQSKTLPI